jgi:hypothetical protein
LVLHIRAGRFGGPTTSLCNGKEKRLQLAIAFLAVAEHRFPKFKAERDDPLFAAFAIQGDKQIFEVNFRNAQRKRLRDAATYIKQEKDESM